MNKELNHIKMKHTEKVCKILDKIVSKNQSTKQTVDKLCVDALQLINQFLMLPKNENLMDDDDYIFIDDCYHNEISPAQCLFYLANILEIKIRHKSEAKNVFQSYCAILCQEKIDMGELKSLNNRFDRVIHKIDDQNEEVENAIVSFANAAKSEKCTNSAKSANSAKELNDQMLSVIEKMDDTGDDIMMLKQLIYLQKGCFS